VQSRIEVKTREINLSILILLNVFNKEIAITQNST